MGHLPVNSFNLLEFCLLILQLLLQLLLAQTQMLYPLPQLSLLSRFLVLLLLEPFLGLDRFLTQPTDLIITLLHGLKQQDGRGDRESALVCLMKSGQVRYTHIQNVC